MQETNACRGGGGEVESNRDQDSDNATIILAASQDRQ